MELVNSMITKLQAAGFTASQARFLAVRALADFAEVAGHAANAAELRRRFNLTEVGA